MWRRAGIRWAPPALPDVWGRVSTPLQVALLSAPIDSVERFGPIGTTKRFGVGSRNEIVTARFMDGRIIETRDALENRVIAYFERMQSDAMGRGDVL